ncbi:hypothetical protein E8E13_003630 [Curvularia kusanoi]|uniref:G-protein coupled receptors family 2 profile 2 domain-containing protein n=1 Tax=Curvularia kusanoi TaxID=90978 RepID=A0A9P4THH6_CURKU|nr:hypothetical protein E8E13_003630 [Curvularia kusanoi]
MDHFSRRQITVLEAVKCASSVASLLGSLFIIATFSFSASFRTTRTRLIFFSTWGNMLVSVAMLMQSTAFANDSTKNRSVCELQAFLLLTFSLADPFWIFCMTLNVIRIIIMRFDGRKIRSFDKWYFLAAYGIPAVAAATYVLHDQFSDNYIVGPVGLWCGITPNFLFIRVAFFFFPAWGVIVGIVLMHSFVASKIYKVKAALRRVTKPSSNPRGVHIMTEISVANTTLEADTEQLTRSLSGTTLTPTPQQPSSLVTWDPDTSRVRHSQREVGTYTTTVHGLPDAYGQSVTISAALGPIFRSTAHAAFYKRRKENNNAVKYFKTVSLLFFVLVWVWFPPSIHVIYGLVNPHHNEFSWVSFGLHLADALMVPTQGFWNAIIYAHATWSACKQLYEMIMTRLAGGRLSSQPEPAEEAFRFNTRFNLPGSTVRQV